MRVAVLWLGPVAGDTGGRTYLRELLGPLGGLSGLEVDVHVADPAFEVPTSCRRILHRVPRALGAATRPVVELAVAGSLNSRYDVLLAPFNNLPPTWRGPSVVVEHNVLAFGPNLSEHVGWIRSLWRPLALRLSLGRASQVIAVSAYLRRLLLESFPELDPAAVHVVHHGAAVGVHANGRPRACDPQAPRLLAVAALWPHKRVDQAIRVLGALLRRRPGASLVVAGPFTPRQHAEHWRLVLELGLEEHVSFLGNVGADRLGRLYLDADALLYLSQIESFGLPVIEAMLLGVPVVAREIEGVVEIGGDGPAWVPADANDDTVAARVEQVLDDDAFRAERIAAGREQAARFTWQRAAEETASVLDVAVGAR